MTDALYKDATAFLWVEDPDTAAWLNALWRGAAPTIRILVAGGHPNVAVACKQAQESGHRHVFGLVDQDFGSTNRHRWSTLQDSERVYRLDVHEFENLLLDPIALVSSGHNTANRTESEVEKKIADEAKRRLWWRACAKFLVDTSQASTNGYPSIPANVWTSADAENRVMTSTWFSSTAATCPGLALQPYVVAQLNMEYLSAEAELRSGQWITSFPGKEIFREVSSYVHPNKGANGRLDLIKSIGRWQLDKGKVPSQVDEVRSIILARI